MFYNDLNKRFQYTLSGKRFGIDSATFRAIYHSNIGISDWGKVRFKKYLEALKEAYYFGQGRRCAFCRTRVRIGAYWEDMEHLVAQTTRENWIYYPKNLVVICVPCNRLKNASETLADPNQKYFPLNPKGFTIFNPHFELWSDHFEIVKGIFLRGRPGSKGPETYKKYHLYRYHVAIGYSEELKMWKSTTMRRLTHLLRDSTLTSDQIRGIQEGIDYLIKLRKHGRPNDQIQR